MNPFIGDIFEKFYKSKPITFVDIGASGGLPKKWNLLSEHLQVIGFEPDKKEFNKLKSAADPKKNKYINSALYKECTTVDFFITKKQQVSSILPPDRDFLNKFPEPERFDILKSEKLTVDTLDNQLSTEEILDIDFIKIDSQGSELYILQGATETLKDVYGLEIEIEFGRIYEGQPLFPDVDNFLRNRGFVLFDLKPTYWKREEGRRYGKKKGQLIYADALYLRDTKNFGVYLDKQNEQFKKSKVLRAISICILHGYLDYALELINDNLDVFSEIEINMFKENLKKDIPLSNKLPYFRGRGRIANLFWQIYNILNPGHKGWASSDKVLGNIE